MTKSLLPFDAKNFFTHIDTGNGLYVTNVLNKLALTQEESTELANVANFVEFLIKTPLLKILSLFGYKQTYHGESLHIHFPVELMADLLRLFRDSSLAILIDSLNSEDFISTRLVIDLEASSIDYGRVCVCCEQKGLPLNATQLVYLTTLNTIDKRFNFLRTLAQFNSDGINDSLKVHGNKEELKFLPSIISEAALLEKIYKESNNFFSTGATICTFRDEYAKLANFEIIRKMFSELPLFTVLRQLGYTFILAEKELTVGLHPYIAKQLIQLLPFEDKSLCNRDSSPADKFLINASLLKPTYKGKDNAINVYISFESSNGKQNTDSICIPLNASIHEELETLLLIFNSFNRKPAETSNLVSKENGTKLDNLKIVDTNYDLNMTINSNHLVSNFIKDLTSSIAAIEQEGYVNQITLKTVHEVMVAKLSEINHKCRDGKLRGAFINNSVKLNINSLMFNQILKYSFLNNTSNALLSPFKKILSITYNESGNLALDLELYNETELDRLAFILPIHVLSTKESSENITQFTETLLGDVSSIESNLECLHDIQSFIKDLKAVYFDKDILGKDTHYFTDKDGNTLPLSTTNKEQISVSEYLANKLLDCFSILKPPLDSFYTKAQISITTRADIGDSFLVLDYKGNEFVLYPFNTKENIVSMIDILTENLH